jgi:hypothetical protein
MRSLNPITSSPGFLAIPYRSGRWAVPPCPSLSLIACELFEDARGAANPPCSNEAGTNLCLRITTTRTNHSGMLFSGNIVASFLAENGR